jgi:glycosyltransferase involved in cell wall biosynthesis
MNISVLIITYNESSNIESCIKALDWTDDIIVLDSFSSDLTCDIALKLGARIYKKKFVHFSDQRNYGLNNINFKYDWVLHLDADEIVTPELYKEMIEVIKKNNLKNDYDAFQISSKMIFFGKWIKYSSMYPVYQVRLGHKYKLRFKRDGHGQYEDMPFSRIGTLNEPYIHHSFSKGISNWIEKHNLYSEDEAKVIIDFEKEKINLSNLISKNKTSRRRVLKKISYYLPLRPTLKFLFIYLFNLGFLDGYRGFIYCKLISFYELMIMLKVKEINNNKIK